MLEKYYLECAEVNMIHFFDECILFFLYSSLDSILYLYVCAV